MEDEEGRRAQVIGKRPCVVNPISVSATPAAGTESQDTKGSPEKHPLKGGNAQVTRKRARVENPSSDSETAAADDGTKSQDTRGLTWKDYGYRVIREEAVVEGRRVMQFRRVPVDPRRLVIPPEVGRKRGIRPAPTEEAYTKSPFYQAAVAAGLKVQGRGSSWWAEFKGIS